MNVLIDDIIAYIMTFLTDIEKIKFLSLEKRLHMLKNKVQYNSLVHNDVICNLVYYDMFTNVRINRLNSKCNRFPKYITHLTFGDTFNNDITGLISNSIIARITHLTFGAAFDQDIKGCIPTSVIH